MGKVAFGSRSQRLLPRQQLQQLVFSWGPLRNTEFEGYARRSKMTPIALERRLFNYGRIQSTICKAKNDIR